MKDKILFWISNYSLVHFGIAKFLQDKHNCDLFALFDVTDNTKKFFQNQQLVKFNKTWYYHDHFSNSKPDLEYLANFEKKYGLNLWTYACNDRIFYRFNQYHKFSTDEILTILTQELKLYESILDEIKPNFIAMTEPTLRHNYLFCKICKIRGIDILMFTQYRLGRRCKISNFENVLTGIENYPDDKVHNRTLDELQNYLKGFDIFKQTTGYRKKFLASKRNLLQAVCKFLISQNSNHKTHYSYYGRTKLNVLIKSIFYLLKTKYREIFINKNFITKLDDESFIYFPLHIEEESTLLIAAPFYTNQLEVIKQIVKSLPIGYKLYVKEHPSMYTRGWRKISEYKQMMALPNIKLIHYSVPSEDVIKKSSLILSISGTSGFEAAFYQKPSIVFTDTDFSILPSVYRLKTIEELPSSIMLSLQKSSVDTFLLNKYIDFINDSSFQFDYTELAQDVQDYFHYSGFLADVEIPSEKMQTFLEEHKSQFEQLATEHIKKINQYKNKN